MSGLRVVLGAGGGLGNAIARELERQGHQVRAVNRSGRADLPDGIDVVAADLYDETSAKRAVAGADVVYHAAQPPYDRWPGNFERMNRSVLAAAESTAGRLVFLDNLYMYGPAATPLDENAPQRATDRKGELRRRLAEELLEAHRGGRVPVTILRASDYFGPRGHNSLVMQMVIAPGTAGRAMRWPGRWDQPHTLAYLPDTARGAVAAGEDAAACGEVWHLPAAPPISGRDFIELVNRALPRRVKAASVPRWMWRLGALFNSQIREGLVVSYQFTGPWVSDHSKFATRFGPMELTPLEVAAAETIEWVREAGR